MNTSLESNRHTILQDRAHMLAKSRAFFLERSILEVDCPVLGLAAPIETHIDIMTVNLGCERKAFLHSSPEYAMKRLLSEGMGDIYQISHVFRQSEAGPLHNPEFTLVEWYRRGFSLDEMIQETLQYMEVFFGINNVSRLSYREVFYHHVGLDYLTAQPTDLWHKSLELSSPPPQSASWDKDTWLDYLMSFVIQPKLGVEEMTVIDDYPASQAALAQVIQKKDISTAQRFEIFHRGIELANGYLELIDYQEQKKRLEDSLKKRAELGKKPLPIDKNFLAALKKGLPPCSGVAVGFDRLMYLRHDSKHIRDILPFSISEA